MLCILLLSFIVVFDCIGKTWGKFSEINSLGNAVSTGIVSVAVLDSDTGSMLRASLSDQRIVPILNDGTLPIKYVVRETSRSLDCNSFTNINIVPSSGALRVGETKNIEISFLKRDDFVEGINCIVTAKIIVWQEMFDSPMHGFTMEDDLEFQINI